MNLSSTMISFSHIENKQFHQLTLYYYKTMDNIETTRARVPTFQQT